jgi:hypothetical protein
MSIESMKLLHSGYPYGPGINLDLYGLPANEDRGHIVVTATLVGSATSLAYILNDDTLDLMGVWLDRKASEAYRMSRVEARAERFDHEREMSRLDHQWRSI